MWRKRIQLGLIHMAVAMTLVPINSTLNRVMIKELALSATLVAVLASLPYLFSPIQVAIGSFSDRHPVFGFRRTPYILAGLLLCVLGVIAAPYAAFQMAENPATGIFLAVITFGAWGMGFNLATVSYFSLASEISNEKGRVSTIGVMFFMMIVGIIFTAIGLSRLLNPYSPEMLFGAFRVIALIALALGVLGLVRVEGRSQMGKRDERYDFGLLTRTVLKNRQVTYFFWYLILMLAAILGQDVLLEPFAGEAFGMPVEATTRITSIWGACVLLTLLVAHALEKRFSKRTVAKIGAWGGILAFVLIAFSGIVAHQGVFYSGVVILGVSTGLATISNLSLMLDMTVAGQVGLFIGAWGMANALARLVGSVMSGAVRDLVSQVALNPTSGYVAVFIIEAMLLGASLLILERIDVEAFKTRASHTSTLERAAIASDL